MVDFTIEIARAPAEAFAYVADWRMLATWQPNTVSAVPERDGPLGVGSRIREVRRAAGGKKIQELVEVAEHEPDRVLGLRVPEGQPLHGRITREADRALPPHTEASARTLLVPHGLRKTPGALADTAASAPEAVASAR